MRAETAAPQLGQVHAARKRGSGDRLEYLEVAAILVAFWPVWLWYCERIFDRSDEPLGVVALLTAVFVCYYKHNQDARERSSGLEIKPEPSDCDRSKGILSLTAIQLATLIIYCLTFFIAPPLVQAAVAVASVTLLLVRTGKLRQPVMADCTLLALSLPLIATLNFYLGYPLRLLSSHIAALMLNLGGLSVVVNGASLLWNSIDISIDQPCSGIRMLWVALFLAATLASLKRLRAANTALLLAFSVLGAVLANSLRVSSLFYLEAGIISLEAPWHELAHNGIGVVTFVSLAAAICAAAVACERLAERHTWITAAHAGSLEFYGIESKVNRSLKLSLILLCAVAALIPVFHIAPALLNTSEQFAGWPLQFEHQPLHEVPLAPDSAAFADRFPGRIKVFTTGSRRVVMRWVCKPTRQLHPSSSCYSAGGFSIKWLPEFTDQSGQRWNQFEANRAAERLLVRERIYDNHGHSWTDISAWYWSAVLKETNSPWWNVTVAERLR